MKFIQIILQHSTLKEAKLYSAAQKAFNNPEIGITIQNKAAYHVIKDCANIALNYLPLFAFGSYLTPFEDLKGKFKKEDIKEFVEDSKNNVSTKQLLDSIIYKAEKLKLISVAASNFDLSDIDDPYGEYGSSETLDSTPHEGDLNEYEVLCKLFLS